MGAGWGATGLCLAFKVLQGLIFSQITALRNSDLVLCRSLLHVDCWVSLKSAPETGHEWRNEVHKSFAHSALVYGVLSPVSALLTQCYCKLSCCCCLICEAGSQCSCGAAELLCVFLSPCCKALNVLHVCQEKSVELECEKCTVLLVLLKLFFLTQFAYFFPFLEFLKTWIPVFLFLWEQTFCVVTCISSQVDHEQLQIWLLSYMIQKMGVKNCALFHTVVALKKSLRK